MRYATIVVLMVFVAVPVRADQSAPTLPLSMKFGALREKQPADPYKQLFDAQQNIKAALTQARAKADVAPAPKVVCGMTLIPADPEIDPKMAVPAPKDNKTRYTIRALEPSICKAQ